MNKSDPYAMTGNPVTNVEKIFGTLPKDRWIEALAIALAADPDGERRLRTAVFQVSGALTP